MGLKMGMNGKLLRKLFHTLGVSWLIMANVCMFLICLGVLTHGGSIIVVEQNIFIVTTELFLTIFGIAYLLYYFFKVMDAIK